MPKEVYIVIPCYNETAVIADTIRSLDKLPYKVVVVDDGSAIPVDTYLNGLNVFYLRHQINLGQGAALQTGTQFAYENGADVVIHFDADGQHNPDDIPVMLKTMDQNGSDVILGSRFINPEHTKEIPPVRKLILRVARLVNGVFTGLWLTDAHNGFRCLNRRAMQLIRIKENRMAHATEILQLIEKHKLKYTEVPTHITYTQYSMKKGQSSLNSLNIFIDLVLNSFR
jgi:polyprenyl-phospho-N-acetylgalactosaminyl synthase